MLVLLHLGIPFDHQPRSLECMSEYQSGRINYKEREAVEPYEANCEDVSEEE